jgi:ArsR family transcriptional regulator
MLELETYFRVLADKKRFRIVQYLASHDEVPVTALGAALRLSQPLISWHLRRLRRTGLVSTRRSGRQVLCSLNRTSFCRYQEKLSEMLDLDSRRGGGEDDLPFEHASA